MNINIVKFLTASLLLALSTTSCLQLTEDQDSAYGYLSLSELSAEVEVYELVPTKSGTTTLDALGVTDFNQPNIGDVTFTLTGPNDYSKIWTGALENDLTLPVGTYNLKAVYNNPKEYDGLGEALYGTVETDVHITSLKNESPRLKFPLINALVMVDVSEDLKKDFVLSSDVVNFVDKSTKDNLFSAGLGVYNFIPADREMDVVVYGVNSAGVSADLVYNLPSMNAKSAKHITFGKSDDWPEILWDEGTNLNDGAFEGSLYFHPVTIANMSDVNKAKLTYQIKGGEFSNWTKVENISDVKIGDETYKLISRLTNGTTYSLKASVGNIQSVELNFTTVSFQSCLSVTSVTAAHNNAGNPDVELSSTTMTAHNVKVELPEIIAEIATIKASGSFSSANNGAEGQLSEFIPSAAAPNVEFSNASGWPYLPQGNYSATISAVCGINGTDYTASSTTEVTVPAPNFKVTVSAYTSYDWYKEGNITNANNMENRLKVSGRKVKLGISEALLQNTNYTDLLTESAVLYNGSPLTAFSISSDSKNELTYVDLTYDDSQWGAYEFNSKVKFDGVESSGSHTCHITGLPYSMNFSKNNKNGWSTSGSVSWEDEYIRLGNWTSGEASVSRNDFYIPEPINVYVSARFDAYRASIGTKFIMNLSGNDVITKEGNKYMSSTSYDEKNVEAQMTNGSVLYKNTYSAGNTHSKLYTATLIYR